MLNFIDTVEYYKLSLKKIKTDFEDSIISKETALEKVNIVIKELEDLLYAYDLIYPYNWIKKLEKVLEDYKDFASSLKTAENNL